MASSFNRYKNMIRANLGDAATQCPYTEETAQKKKLQMLTIIKKATNK